MSDTETPECSRPTSPTGSEGSTSSRSSSRKRDREDGDDGKHKPPPAKKIMPAPPRTRQAHSIENVMEGITAITETLASYKTILDDIPGIRSTLNAVTTDLTAQRTTTERLTNVTDSLSRLTDCLVTENRELKDSLQKLEARVDQLALAGPVPSGSGVARELSRLAAATNSTAAHVQRELSMKADFKDLTVSGFVFGRVEEPTLLRLASVIAAALGVDTGPDDFVSARLLRKKPNTDAASSASTSSRESRPCAEPTRTTFAVVCGSTSLAHRLLAAKRRHGLLRFSMLDRERLAGVDITPPPAESVINLNELLPSRVLQVLTTAKKTLKPAGFKHVWCRHHTVLAKKSDDGITHTVNAIGDVTKLLSLYPDQRE